MNTTLLIAELRDLLDDPNGVKFSDQMLIRTANRQMRGLFRTMVQANKEYSNYTIGFHAAGYARQVLNTTWEFRMPTWITQVVDVYQPNSNNVPDDTYASYMWDAAAVQELQYGQRIQKWTSNAMYPHWSWEGNNNTLRLWNFTVCPDILVRVAVRPPVLFKATIATESPLDTNRIYLPPTPEYGDYEFEEGAFINAAIEVTETADVNSTNFAQVRRVIYSSSNTVISGSRTYVLDLDQKFTSSLEPDDVIESIVPIPDQHTRILVLKTAQACFQRKNNVDGLRAISGELTEEFVKFTAYAAGPRDSNGPTYLKRTLSNRPSWPMTNPIYGWWGGF